MKLIWEWLTRNYLFMEDYAKFSVVVQFPCSRYISCLSILSIDFFNLSLDFCRFCIFHIKMVEGTVKACGNLMHDHLTISIFVRPDTMKNDAKPRKINPIAYKPITNLPACHLTGRWNWFYCSLVLQGQNKFNISNLLTHFFCWQETRVNCHFAL